MVQVVTGDSQEKVMIFRDKQTLHHNIYIITRPKPAYGRQVLAVSWGQDADEVSTFLGVLNVSLRGFGAQLRFKQTWDP